MSDAVKLDELTQFEGKKFTITVADGDEGSLELENVQLVGVTPAGAVFQVPKRGAVLYKEGQVLGYEPPKVKPPKLKVRNQKPIESDKLVDHLLHVHGQSYEQLASVAGVSPQQVNARELNEDQLGALSTFHDSLHDASNGTLGHRHGAPVGESAAEQAVAAAAQADESGSSSEDAENAA